ncbi:hypothetical protein AAFF_G00251760 [Aldrovandia affinis]|uniref:Uncharacterized protein n=1 Tax=Aldrovandia affinis TaxID=143900 RepID=A0AAD7STP1_9TELE|nr:hypothetical protein AAFF_G00251760 [Aldrovandia affinis]
MTNYTKVPADTWNISAITDAVTVTVARVGRRALWDIWRRDPPPLSGRRGRTASLIAAAMQPSGKPTALAVPQLLLPVSDVPSQGPLNGDGHHRGTSAAASPHQRWAQCFSNIEN